MSNNRAEGERGTRPVWGVLLLVLVVFVVPSLLSYDWADIPLLKAREPQTPQNMIGPVGAWLAFWLFVTLGVGAYLAPLWLALAGLALILSRARRVWPQIAWCSAFVLAAVLIQEFFEAGWAERRTALNIDPYTSGLLGRLVMKGFLIRWLKPVGAGILTGSVFVVSLVMSLGMGTILRTIRDVWGWLTRLRSGLDDMVSKPADKRRLIEMQERELEKQRLYLEKALARQQRAQDRDERDERDERERDRRELQEARDHALKAEIERCRRAEQETRAGRVQEQPEPPPRPKEAPRRKFEPGSAPEPVPAEETPGGELAADQALSRVYELPSLDLLDAMPSSSDRAIVADSGIASKILIETLKEFGIEAEATNVEKGPTVTRYELLPAPGVRVEKISALSNNLALSLKATNVRVQAPVPGKGVVGIEVPNVIANMVYIREILAGDEWRSDRARVPMAIGKDVAGKDIVADLTEMPHLLVAGATGSGKTVCINSILLGLLMTRRPDEMRLMLVDPKIVEFSSYNGLPHLIVPVITNPKKVGLGLRWAINEMERRYKLFARTGVRNIESFNHRAIPRKEPDEKETPAEWDQVPEKIPYVVIVIDELADLMLADQAEIENSIARLAQLSRAVGIHMILSTQRPSVNVITGTIKANFPARIAFQVAQKVDSRTILDTVGADKLLGRGDMLFLPPGVSKLVRAQGAWAADEEIHRVVEFWRKQGEPRYEMEIKERIEKTGNVADDDEADDELIEQSLQIIRETRRASTSSLQRRLRIGYTRAARIMDILEQKGIVGPPRGSDPREILIDLDGEIPDNMNGSDLSEPADDQ
ncbi:MAG: DNA translocase FtsK 4TM domain-containing protein [Verrucomicrobiota bacterium]|nr:DNA translocase FtsK 4TM domain-containing protein [Verrucomicrobiota bacterium]